MVDKNTIKTQHGWRHKQQVKRASTIPDAKCFEHIIAEVIVSRLAASSRSVKVLEGPKYPPNLAARPPET